MDLELCDFEGNVIQKSEFTIAGVLENERGTNINRSFDGRISYTFPQVFLYCGDMPENSARDLLANYAVGTDIQQMKREWEDKGIAFYNGGRIMMLNVTAFAPLTEISEAGLNEALGEAQKDFYAYALIPTFSGIVLIVAFVSVYNVISTSLSERKRQLAMLRCIGMERRQTVRLALAETLFMVISGMVIGFALGVAVYISILAFQKSVGIIVYPAFRVNNVIRATTVNPYVFPAVSCFICSFLAVLLPYIKELNSSPIEGMQRDDPITHGKPLGIKSRGAVLGKMSGGVRQNLSCFIIILIVSWAAVFGYSYFSSQSVLDNRVYRLRLEDSQLMGLDFLAQRDFYSANCGSAQLNRHSSGISPEFAARIYESNDAKTVYSMIEAKSTKAVYRVNEADKDILEAISTVNLDNIVQTGLEELYEKSLRTQGYLEDEELFNIPTVGVSADTLDLLTQYLIDGNIDKEKLLSGEEVLLLQTTEYSPYSVGDRIPMTDVVIDDPAAEEFDFSHGYVPEGYEPDFYFQYTDNGNPDSYPGYAFGQRCDYEVTVGGHIVISDPEIAAFFYTEGLVGDCGFNILCATNAFSQWGLPDRNYSRLGVRLAEDANAERFDELWYSVIGSSRETGSTSVAAIRRQMNSVTRTNISIFYAMIVIVIILGLMGIMNATNLRIRRQLRTYSVLRAVGFSKRGLMAMILKQGLVYAAVGSVTSFIPLSFFELVRRNAIAATNAGVGIMLTAQNGRMDIPWQSLFPRYIELFAQPVPLIICAVFGMMCMIILLSNVIPATWIARKNITEALRNDDF
ncbi:MAG: ABC transporter permease [Acetatifactor sp.]|nr:ABC transporter permease [Acetatifactor sp.]